jgi:hypothetical protein
MACEWNPLCAKQAISHAFHELTGHLYAMEAGVVKAPVNALRDKLRIGQGETGI